jgi:hypothetical protein
MSDCAEDGVVTLRFLVTVKTYPSPSVRYLETVCTGGITDDGRWIRLYPVPFRYWSKDQQYKLYDWVEIDARKRPISKDKRKESYEPSGGGNLIVTGSVGTRRNWQERKRVILPYALPSVEALLQSYDVDGTSLGIIRPAKVHDVVVEADSADWSPQHRKHLEQMSLFGPAPKHLEKPSHRFSYRFTCSDPSCNGHTLQITDWGLSVLYLRTRAESGENEAVSKTRMKCWELVGGDRDAYFYVGTTYPYKSCIVLGVFSPKKEPGDGRIQMRFD